MLLSGNPDLTYEVRVDVSRLCMFGTPAGGRTMTIAAWPRRKSRRPANATGPGTLVRRGACTRAMRASKP